VHCLALSPAAASFSALNAALADAVEFHFGI